MHKIKKILEIEIEIPMVPNFIRYGERKTLPVSHFSDEELKEIGIAWTAELIKKAKQMRK